MKQWYRLDNAGKIFPSSSTKKRINIFRISATLTEAVDPLILSEAVNAVIPRFSALNVKLRTGVFWYYLEKNNNKPKVFEETPYILSPIKARENGGFLFRFSYYGKRITLEVFHALTDAYGAIQFLKSVVYTYLTLQGKEIDPKGIVSNLEEREEELQDSFLKNYDGRLKTNYKDPKAVLFKGTSYEDNWLSLICASMDVSKIKEISKKYNATITEFLVALIILTASRTRNILEKNNRPFQVFIPVNLRKQFPSYTLRNFSLYVKTAYNLDDDMALEEILKVVKADMAKELQKDQLLPRIVANVKIEKNPILRVIPLFLKSLVLKLGYNSVAGCSNSLTISNFGNIELPEDMVQYVEKFVFSNGGSKKSPINMAVVSYNGKMIISISSLIVERDFSKEFIRLLSSFGLDVIIETNELEV